MTEILIQVCDTNPPQRYVQISKIDLTGAPNATSIARLDAGGGAQIAPPVIILK